VAFSSLFPAFTSSAKKTMPAGQPHDGCGAEPIMKKSIYDRALRRWLPKRYIHMIMRRTEIEHREKLKTVKASPDRQELEADHYFNMSELDDWLTSIQDDELIDKAAQMDLSLDDIPMPACAPDERPSHWRLIPLSQVARYVV
jgi:hypothetical protein